MRTVREVTASTDFVIFASDLQWPFGVNWGFTRPNATREFGGLGGMDGVGCTGYKKCPSILCILYKYNYSKHIYQFTRS